MSKRKILSVGFHFPGKEVGCLSFVSDRSLLDADIIIFEPTIDGYYISSQTLQGKHILSETGSFKVVEAATHWRSELKTAFDEGKTIFVYLVKPQEVFAYTGEKQYSGTGRNRQTTDIVNNFSSYQAIPFNFDHVTPKRGESIIPTADLKTLAVYWKEFAQYSPYEVYVEGKFSNILLTTKTGNKVVGAMFGGKKGTMIFLPPLHWILGYEGDTGDEDEKEEDEQKWEAYEVVFGKRLLACLVEIDKAIHSLREATPAPNWVQSSEYRMRNEATIEAEIVGLNNEIEELRDRKNALLADLEREGGLRRLLYEKGHELEEAILDALRHLGFTADMYKDAESEFDAVLLSPEGRFLGEAEGKDNSPVNIDKLSQLERNLQEDYARDDVSEYAKGILFGNAYRLTKPQERTEFFTAKCLSGSHRSKIALVRTPDLFAIAKYLKEHDDPAFASECRKAIKQTEGGIVQFPQLSVEEEHSIVGTSSNGQQQG